MRRRIAPFLAAALVAAVAAAGCSTDSDGLDEPASIPGTAKDRKPRDAGDDGRAPAPQESRCPAELSNCRTASGRIVYVERVDPDGDGDAHFVLASRESITAPGLSVIDVKRTLRPHPLPGLGDRLSAAGPVYAGSYGQHQIEAIELHVARGR